MGGNLGAMLHVWGQWVAMGAMKYASGKAKKKKKNLSIRPTGTPPKTPQKRVTIEIKY